MLGISYRKSNAPALTFNSWSDSTVAILGERTGAGEMQGMGVEGVAEDV